MEPKNVVNRFILQLMAHSLNALKYPWAEYEVGPVFIHQKRQLNLATQSNETIRKHDLREIMILLSHHVNKVSSICFYFMIISGEVWIYIDNEATKRMLLLPFCFNIALWITVEQKVYAYWFTRVHVCWTNHTFCGDDIFLGVQIKNCIFFFSLYSFSSRLT